MTYLALTVGKDGPRLKLVPDDTPAGYYEVYLEYGVAQDNDAPMGPPLHSAIQQQLGLKLARRRGPVSVLIVDSADKTPEPL